MKRICKDIISKLTWLKSRQNWVAEICFPISKFLYYLGCLFLLLPNTEIWFTFLPTETWLLTQLSNPTFLNMVTDNHLSDHFLVTLLFFLFVIFMTYEYILCRNITLFICFHTASFDLCLLFVSYDLYG